MLERGRVGGDVARPLGQLLPRDAELDACGCRATRTTATTPTASCRATRSSPYLERYAALRGAGARRRRRHRRCAPARDGGFALETPDGALARATRRARHRRLPARRTAAGAAALPADLLQLDVAGYRNPGDLPAGPVLVVGSGQSGCQIAEELHQAGRDGLPRLRPRPVAAAADRRARPRLVGDETGLPRRSRSSSLPDAGGAARREPASRPGHGGGHDLHLRTLRRHRRDAARPPRAAPTAASARFAHDLGESVAWGDAALRRRS